MEKLYYLLVGWIVTINPGFLELIEKMEKIGVKIGFGMLGYILLAG